MSRKKFVILLSLLVIVLSAITFYLFYYPKLAQVNVEEGTLKEKFKKLYESDEEFRKAVDELRKMVLDPEQPYDKDKALKLFNTVLEKLELPKMSPLNFNFGKSVHTKASRVPPKPECQPPPQNLVLKIVQPKSDVEEGNGVEEVYMCYLKHGASWVIEVTVVFSDEDHPQPNSLDDIWYDVWRLISWGRVEDIETFYIILHPMRTFIKYEGLAIILNESLGIRSIAPIGSDYKSFGSAAHEEGTETLEGTEITIYVNTWNHAFSIQDTNKNTEKIVYEYTPDKAKIGLRLDAENNYSMLKYLGEILLLP